MRSKSAIIVLAASMLLLAGCASGSDATAHSLAERALSSGSDGLCEGASPGQGLESFDIGETTGDESSQTVKFEGISSAIGEVKGTVYIDIIMECVSSVTVTPR